MRIQMGGFIIDTEAGLYIAGPRFELFASNGPERGPAHKFADCWHDDGTLYVHLGPWEITASLLPASAPRDAGDAAAEAAQ